MKTKLDNMKELTLRGMILGAIITVIFTASNVYLGLKVGLTFSSAIPAAVISMAILKLFSGSNILENNMVQTQASAAGTLSSIIFILPGLLMISYWQNFPFWKTTLICSAGGILGVIFSIPLRQAMVVQSSLPFPEGVAAAEILKVGCDYEEQEGEGISCTSNQTNKNQGMQDILIGATIAASIRLIVDGFRVVSDSISYWFVKSKSIFQIPMGFPVALFSAGYLIGIDGGLAVIVGIISAWGIAIPILSHGMPVDVNNVNNIAKVATELWKSDVKFIGAGVIAIAAIWTLLKLAKPMMDAIKLSYRTLKEAKIQGIDVPRTERDLSFKSMLLLIIGMLIILGFTFYSFIVDAQLSLGLTLGLIIFSVLFTFIVGFLVAAACGYMAGLVGSSASPISGIGIIAVVLSALILASIGKATGLTSTDSGIKFVIALTIFITSATLVVASISNDNLQDLKTGYLVKATPWRQQVALLVGCVVGAIVIAPVMQILYEAYGFAGALPRAGMNEIHVLSAPQATLMTAIANGILSQKMEWKMIFIGLALGTVIIIVDVIFTKLKTAVKIPPLAVGLGIYLPPSITTPIVVGAFLAYFIQKRVRAKALMAGKNVEQVQKLAEQKGTLIASGLIVGESIMGVILAATVVASITSGGSDAPLAWSSFPDFFGDSAQTVMETAGLAIFIGVCIFFTRRVLSVAKFDKTS